MCYRRILGIDPGLRFTGYGIIDFNSEKNVHVVSGRIITGKNDFYTKLGKIYKGIEVLIKQYKPNEVAIEQIFIARNPNSALKLGQARGAAISAVVIAGVPVYEYASRLVKLTIASTGKASKKQVKYMVRVLLTLGGNKKLTEDQSDALAIALCHSSHI